jgi:hypothetical protein
LGFEPRFPRRAVKKEGFETQTAWFHLLFVHGVVLFAFISKTVVFDIVVDAEFPGMPYNQK